MQETLEELMARHDALAACGACYCDDDYCAYLDQANAQDKRRDHARHQGIAAQRPSVRHQFEHTPPE